MYKLQLTPSSTSYGASINSSVVSVEREALLPTYRSDQITNMIDATVQFDLTDEEYRYMMAFYRAYTDYGKNKFLMDMVLHGPEMDEYEVRIKPGTFKLTSNVGLGYFVSFSVEAYYDISDADFYAENHYTSSNTDFILFDGEDIGTYGANVTRSRTATRGYYFRMDQGFLNTGINAWPFSAQTFAFKLFLDEYPSGTSTLLEFKGGAGGEVRITSEGKISFDALSNDSSHTFTDPLPLGEWVTIGMDISDINTSAIWWAKIGDTSVTKHSLNHSGTVDNEWIIRLVGTWKIFNVVYDQNDIWAGNETSAGYWYNYHTTVPVNYNLVTKYGQEYDLSLIGSTLPKIPDHHIIVNSNGTQSSAPLLSYEDAEYSAGQYVFTSGRGFRSPLWDVGNGVMGVAAQKTDNDSSDWYFIRSDDNGETWAEIAQIGNEESGQPSCIAYGNGTWVVGGGSNSNNGSYIWYSTNNGNSWTKRVVDSYRYGGEPEAICFFNGLFCLSVTSITRGNVWTSSDGISWTKRYDSNSSGVAKSMNKVAFNDQRVAFMGTYYSGTGSYILSSSDGTTWEKATELNGKACQGDGTIIGDTIYFSVRDSSSNYYIEKSTYPFTSYSSIYSSSYRQLGDLCGNENLLAVTDYREDEVLYSFDEFTNIEQIGYPSGMNNSVYGPRLRDNEDLLSVSRFGDIAKLELSGVVDGVSNPPSIYWMNKRYVAKGYKVDHASRTVANKLEGAEAFYSRTKDGKVDKVSVTWIVDTAGYDYLMAFYRTGTLYGSLPFRLNLIVGDTSLDNLKVRIDPGSFALSSKVGGKYEVKATLWVEPEVFDLEDDLELLEVFSPADIIQDGDFADDIQDGDFTDIIQDS